MIPPALRDAAFVPIPGGEKRPAGPWRDVRLTVDEAEQHVARGGNIALRVEHIADVDLDAPEALTLADTYLLCTGAQFGRPSKPRSHRLYRAPGVTYTAFADPTDGTMLLELRAPGRDGGAHLTLVPPSETHGERREWHGDVIEPAAVDAPVLARRCAWLAIGALIARHVSWHAAQRPWHDLPDLLWEADPALGRRAYYWLGRLAPDEQPPDLKPRRSYSPDELRLEEIVAAIPNNCSWEEWNRIGMAIYAASGGSEIGRVAFDDFSTRCPSKYDPHAVWERWHNYRLSPPSRISLGTLVHLAQQAGWRRSAA